MISVAVVKIIVGALSAILLGWYAKWKFYQSGKQTQREIYKDAEIKQGNKEKEVLGMLAQPDASSDDELIGRLRGKRRR